jgi:hypothetical protein
MGTLLMRLLLACISISAAACLAQTSLAAEGRKSPGKFDRIAEPGDAANRTLLVIVRAFAAQPATIHQNTQFRDDARGDLRRGECHRSYA